MLNNQVAVVAVPESQLFVVQQPQQGDSIQQEADLTNEDDVTASAPNVTDPNELAINVLQPSSGSLPEGGMLAEAAANTAPNDVKVSGALSYTVICRATASVTNLL